MGYSEKWAMRTARTPGYVLVGPSGRVYRRISEGSKDVEEVPRYVDEAVYGLLQREKLDIGETEYVTRDDGQQDIATAVIVPVKSGEEDAEECLTCGGNGEFQNAQCRDCWGKGRREKAS
jgi:hypothetical protein